MKVPKFSLGAADQDNNNGPSPYHVMYTVDLSYFIDLKC
jgi:hypothetical protein